MLTCNLCHYSMIYVLYFPSVTGMTKIWKYINTLLGGNSLKIGIIFPYVTMMTWIWGKCPAEGTIAWGNYFHFLTVFLKKPISNISDKFYIKSISYYNPVNISTFPPDIDTSSYLTTVPTESCCPFDAEWNFHKEKV